MRSENSFEFDGDLIIVDAVVVGPSGKAELRLALDTGAVLTTLVPRIAEQLIQSRRDRTRRGWLLVTNRSPARRRLHPEKPEGPAFLRSLLLLCLSGGAMGDRTPDL